MPTVNPATTPTQATTPGRAQNRLADPNAAQAKPNHEHLFIIEADHFTR